MRGVRSSLVLGAMLVAAMPLASARQSAPAAPAVAIDSDDIGGVVSGPAGPEAGVWVIAETRDLPTKLAKIVVTDDQGRYLLPDLPKANYDIWVRGYGLVDSPKTTSAPGKTLNLKAVPAPDKKAAAEYYPAQYWFSLLQLPPKSDFPGTGPQGNGISPNMKSQGEWVRNIVTTDGCTGCHQLGNKATRENSRPRPETTVVSTPLGVDALARELNTANSSSSGRAVRATACGCSVVRCS